MTHEGFLLSMYNHHARMQATIPVVYQFKQWKQDILHPVSVLPTGTVCEQRTMLIKSNFGLHKVFIVRLTRDVIFSFFGTAGTAPRRYAYTDIKVL